MDFRTAAAGALLAGLAAGLAGCAALDARAVAETHRLDDAPYYVDVAPSGPAPGACALVLPVEIDARLREALGYADRLDRLQPIVDALNARLADRRDCVKAAHEPVAATDAPRAWVGTADSEFAPPEAESQRLDTDRFAPMVLPLTGVLVDATGHPVRAGAEGIILRDTPFHVQVVGAMRMLDDDTLARVTRDERRADLPGAPLKLDVAFDNLLAQLVRGTPTVPAR